MLSTACGSRRCATSSADVRSTRSERVSDRDTSTTIVAASSRPSMSATELSPARLLDRRAAASPAAASLAPTSALAASTCSAAAREASSHCATVTGMGPASGAFRMAVLTASRCALPGEAMKLTGAWSGPSASR